MVLKSEKAVNILKEAVEYTLWAGWNEISELGWVLITEEQKMLVHSSFYSSTLIIEDSYVGELLHNNFSNLIKEPLLKADPLYAEAQKKMLFESLHAYTLGYYNLCVPALFSIVESGLLYLANDGKFESTRYSQGLKNKLSTSNYHYTLECKLSEICKACESLFGKINFSSTDSEDWLNRHATLHGRRERPYTKIDCLKLFNLILAIKLCYV